MGQLHLPLHNLNTSMIYWMDVSGNHLDGRLQENMWRKLPYLSYLNLSRNYFEGIISSTFCNMSELGRLDLSVNNFSGEVPKELVTGCIADLDILKLSSNIFHGQILSTNFNLTRLFVLRLENNQFSGTLSSDAISRCSGLSILDVSNNYFSGEITGSIGNMTNLVTLIMRENLFKGQLPCEAPFDLLDVSHNFLSGSLPSCSNVLEHIHLQGNKITGSIPDAYINSSYILTLDMRDNRLSGRIPNSIGSLSNLRVLLLRGNHLSGSIPNGLCGLNKIALMDLSNNSFSGSIPGCIKDLSFGNTGVNDDHVFALKIFYTWTRREIGRYGSFLVRPWKLHETDDGYQEEVEVEFVTKRRPSSYKGDILNYMSRLDLSCNNLTGEIPEEVGELSWIHALNLSHNKLRGPIPKTFSGLNQVESLDLSYNSLSGEIPQELIHLHFLAVFTVAHNNLSGRIPDRKAQFGTFEENSYEGNPYLCGPPLDKNCTSIVESPQTPTPYSEQGDAKWYEIDPVAFWASFTVTCLVSFLGVATVLYVNPYWRRRWFNFVEDVMYSCYYFVSDAIRKLSARSV